MKQFIYLPALVLLLFFNVARAADPIDNVAAILKQGNSHALAELCAPQVEITLLGQDNVYLTKQAETVMGDFFIKNKPQQVKVLHRVNSNASYVYSVMLLTTSNGVYRIAVTLNGKPGSMAISELTIDAEKN